MVLAQFRSFNPQVVGVLAPLGGAQRVKPPEGGFTAIPTPVTASTCSITGDFGVGLVSMARRQALQ